MAASKFKDGMVRALFNNEEKARELFYALGNEETDDEIQILTLESVMGESVKNDIAFGIGNRCLVLTEVQSTFNPNMPVRMLEYVTLTYENILDRRFLYGRKKIDIPVPEFYVLYTGNSGWKEDQLIRLSELYAGEPKENSVELVVKVINIGYNMGKEILDKSPTLSDYSLYITRVAHYVHEGYDTKTAELLAADEPIYGEYFTEFLNQHRGEIEDMLSGITTEELIEIRVDEAVEDTTVEDIKKAAHLLRKAGMAENEIPGMIAEEYAADEESIRALLQEE